MESGGSAEHVIVSSGGTVTGVLRWAFELNFYGGTLDFNIADVAPGNEYLVDEQSFIRIDMDEISGYTLTVSDTQANGTYQLVECASGMSDDKSFTVVNTFGEALGTLHVNGITEINDKNYNLHLGDYDALIVTISDYVPPDTTKPTVSNVNANTTAWTTGSVTVTAEFADDVEVLSKLFKIGEEGTWLYYDDSVNGGVTVTENATIYFKAVDTSRNEFEVVEYTVENIDKEKPVFSNIALTQRRRRHPFPSWRYSATTRELPHNSTESTMEAGWTTMVWLP